MKIVKEILNEKFTEDSDPIQDMGIGAVRKYNDFVTRARRRYSNVTKSASNLVRFLVEDEELSTSDIILLFKYIIVRYKIKYIDKLSETMLNTCVFDNDNEKAYTIAKFILDNYHPNLNNFDDDLLYDVVENGNNNIGELLIQRGYDINKGDGTSFCNAIEYGDDTTIKWFLDNGAKCAVKDYAILRAALDEGNDEIVERCIKDYYEEKYNK